MSATARLTTHPKNQTVNKYARGIVKRQRDDRQEDHLGRGCGRGKKETPPKPSLVVHQPGSKTRQRNAKVKVHAHNCIQQSWQLVVTEPRQSTTGNTPHRAQGAEAGCKASRLAASLLAAHAFFAPDQVALHTCTMSA